MSKSVSLISNSRNGRLTPHDVPDVALEARATLTPLTNHSDKDVREKAEEVHHALSKIIALCALASEASDLSPVERAALAAAA